MRVFVAGATGAIGKRLVPQLLAAGNEVVAMTRSKQKTEGLRAAGATPVVADGLDREAVRRAVLGVEPEAVVHQLTALTNIRSFRKFDREFERTNRLRTEASTTCWPRPGRRARGGSWRRASPGGPTRARVDP